MKPPVSDNGREEQPSSTYARMKRKQHFLFRSSFYTQQVRNPKPIGEKQAPQPDVRITHDARCVLRNVTSPVVLPKICHRLSQGSVRPFACCRWKAGSECPGEDCSNWAGWEM